MRRREFLKYGAATGAALVLAPQAVAQQRTVRTSLRIEPVDAEMIDGEVVFMLLFYGPDGPRPVLRATQGDRIELTVFNNDSRAHGFAIPGVGAARIASIPPGSSASVAFDAPRGGSYLYIDPTRAPLNRILGLHGAFIVAPSNPTTPAGVVTPYSRATQTAQVRQLFEALGASERFPGERWSPSRDRVWLFSQIDPVINRRVDLGQAVNPSSVTASFLPRYFTLNGKSGFDAAHDYNTRSHGYVGQPMLLRTLNAGLCTHSPHIHGNHVIELSGIDAQNDLVVRDNLIERDTWMVAPLERKDVLLPYERPPDIPHATWPMVQEPFPLRYPMHCHIEMSQTAGGGNYPQGLIAEWEIDGPLQTGG